MYDVKGNIWNMHADILCITTNGIVKSDGRAVMGAGTAKRAAELCPQLPTILGQLLQNGNYVYELLTSGDRPGRRNRTWCSFPVKDHFKDKASIKLIDSSAKQLLSYVNQWEKDYGFQPIVAVPRPGCGVGGLQWGQVRPVLERWFDDRFYVVTPDDRAA